jgi:hypothetical protein
MAKENDIVLIYMEDRPLFFARIEDISPDIKKNWYHVKLLILTVPLQVITWILRDSYIDGAEYTMRGKKMRIEKIVCPEISEEAEKTEKTGEKNLKPGNAENAKVISLADLKNK